MRDLSPLRVTSTRTPPPGGLDAVVRTARRRVRNRVAGCAAVVAVAALVATTLPSGPRNAGLVGVPPTGTPTPAVTPSAVRTTAPGTVVRSPAPPRVTTVAPTTAAPRPAAPSSAGPASPRPSTSPAAAEQPATYEYDPYDGYVPPPNTADPCVNQDDEAPEVTGWCGHLHVEEAVPGGSVGRGDRVTVQARVCRAEAATPSPLTRSAARWFTLTATGSDGAVAWSWDAGGPPAEAVVQVGTGDCLVWRVAWRVGLPNGTYRMRVRFATEEYRPGEDANGYTVRVLDPA